MMRRRAGLLGAVLLLLAACAEQKPVVIDGSSAAAFDQSSAEARRQLPDADRIVFDRALRTIGSRRHAERDQAALARLTFDGMTAAEVVADQRAREK
jgi:hypothetical protein